MYSRNKYLLKNIGVLALSSFSSRVLLFLLIPVYTSYLTTKEVGVYDLILSTVTILSPILTCNISSGVMRFFLDPSISKHDVSIVGFRYLLLGLFISFILILLCRKYSSVITDYSVYIFLFTFFFTVNHFLICFAKGLEAVSALAVASFFEASSLLLGSVVLLRYLNLALEGFFLAAIISKVISSVCLFTILRVYKFVKIKDIMGLNNVCTFNSIGPNHNSTNSLQWQMLSYSIPIIATYIGWWINSTAGRYLVAFFLGVGANGILSVAYKIPQIVNLFHTVFIQAWQITAIKEWDSDDSKVYYGKMFLLNSFVLNMVGAFTILFTSAICSLIFSSNFYNARFYIPFLIISVIINSVAGFLGPILSAKKNSKALAYSAFLGTVTNLFFAVIFIYFCGTQGACFAAVISSLSIYIVRKFAVESDIIIPHYWTLYVTWSLLMAEAFIEIYTDYIWVESLIVIIIIIVNNKEFSLVTKKGWDICNNLYHNLKKIE
ncbi:oligosaccharide flippase family protein [Succinivibrio dextrinosolvens]|uniref:Membrane protein involved in the export of O-antigen and teichoic acid n=1 Tax=Succinivibrio dextrinosolvens TaxID=83771 RepID=A0A662ZFB0_9GAMM|nr:oligosaccharide flippase family protein [Succinivibrio dextrinosolvens]SFK61087.1 Membrane protein involved in the export of O-antigen and teichoic acid [Succinivibrio dextrinosolvens]